MRYGWTSAAMVTVFFELCFVFYDEVECRAIDTHVTQSNSLLCIKYADQILQMRCRIRHPTSTSTSDRILMLMPAE